MISQMLTVISERLFLHLSVDLWSRLKEMWMDLSRILGCRKHPSAQEYGCILFIPRNHLCSSVFIVIVSDHGNTVRLSAEVHHPLQLKPLLWFLH